jgi:hypothetical protein
MEKEKASDSNRRLATVALGSGGFGSWPIVSTPGLPPERTKMLREAYAKRYRSRTWSMRRKNAAGN